MMIIIKCENKVNISFTADSFVGKHDSVKEVYSHMHTYTQRREKNQTINDARMKTSQSCMGDMGCDASMLKMCSRSLSL